MYWRWKRIPELADLPPEERGRLWDQAMRDPLRVTDVLWVAVWLSACLIIAIPLMFLTTTRPSTWTALVIFLILPCVVTVLFEPILILRYRPVVRRLRRGVDGR